MAVIMKGLCSKCSALELQGLRMRKILNLYARITTGNEIIVTFQRDFQIILINPSANP
jgi:hypothetical protein